jgi:hydroxypyruvate isomerase
MCADVERMLAFSANLSMLFADVPFLERFGKAKSAGFHGVECQFPYDYAIDDLVEQLQRFKLVLALHNLPAGDWSNGERGIGCLPGRIGEFQDGVGRAIEYANALGCTRLNCLAGVAPPAASHAILRDTFLGNLTFAARELDRAGIKLLIEPLNTRDVPGFFLRHSHQAIDIIKDVSADNLYLQYDVYHMDVMEGDIISTLRRELNRVAHVQVADNPGRHEPGTGDIDYPHVFEFLDRSDYAGWIGCEYTPATSTEDSLQWLRSLNR